MEQRSFHFNFSQSTTNSPNFSRIPCRTKLPSSTSYQRRTLDSTSSGTHGLISPLKKATILMIILWKQLLKIVLVSNREFFFRSEWKYWYYAGSMRYMLVKGNRKKVFSRNDQENGTREVIR